MVMSEAITKTNLIMLLVLCFLIGYGIKEMFLITEIEREDYSLSFRTPYLDSLEGKYDIEFVTDNNDEEFAQFIHVYDDEKTILDRMPKSEYDKAVEKDLARSYDINPDISQEELEHSVGIWIFHGRSQERVWEAAQKESETKAENNRKICVQKTDEALDLYYKIKNKEVEHVGLACDELSRLINEIEQIKTGVYSCGRAIYGLPLECG